LGASCFKTSSEAKGIRDLKKVTEKINNVPIILVIQLRQYKRNYAFLRKILPSIFPDLVREPPSKKIFLTE